MSVSAFSTEVPFLQTIKGKRNCKIVELLRSLGFMFVISKSKLNFKTKACKRVLLGVNLFVFSYSQKNKACLLKQFR